MTRHLEERYVVALEEEKDLVEVGGHVERVVEEVEVHLRRQELHRQLPEWEAVKTLVLNQQLSKTPNLIKYQL